MTSADRLYELLPVVYRLRDAEQGEPLRALLSIINDELNAVEADITGLYENWFIETADEWVVPYIGDLLGVRGLNTIKTRAFSQRAYVANTLFYRRRKGTAWILGRLATDVTGWPALAVEYFERLQTTQYMNHIRLFNFMPDLRDTNRLNLLETPFDTLPHTADVRHINNRRGRHNIRNVGIFLWRLQNYAVQDAAPRQAAVGYGWHFSPLGDPAPLFNEPQGEGASQEQQVAAAIRPLDFFLDLHDYQEKFGGDPTPPENSRYYGPARSLQIVKDGTPVTPSEMICKNLSTWDRPPAGFVAVDVTRGRITFAAGEEPTELQVSFNFGFSADIGGGPYDRRARMAEIVPGVIAELQVGVGKTYATLAAALTDWANPTKFDSSPAVIRIYDSASYDANLTIELPKQGWLVIDAENGERPTLLNAFPLKIKAPVNPATAEDTAALTLSGLAIEGGLEIGGKLNLTITDCTLVPGQALDEDGFPKNPKEPSLKVTGTDVTDLSVVIARSITGALQMPAECKTLRISDSIVDASTPKDADGPARAAIAATMTAASPGPVTTLEQVTVFGEVYVKVLELASNVVFTAKARAERRQEGCVRYSHVPDGSQTPRCFQCQPDLTLAAKAKEFGLDSPASLPADVYAETAWRVRPQFTSIHYGNPAYAQLAQVCAWEIRSGAEDGSEMGAFSLLQQPQREANLRIALEEYMRFGLEAGIFFVT
jgi:hypothetical protein